MEHPFQDLNFVSKRTTVADFIKQMVSDPSRDEPFFVCDLGDIVGKIQLWKQKLPRIRPFYAVKANSEPLILKLMTEYGVGFDCASKAEIEMVLATGATSKDIVFAHPQKFVSHLVHASKEGVDLMTFDSDYELHKIKKHFPSARLLLRFSISNVDAKYPLSSKFGCDPSESQALLKLARNLDLNVVGLAFHVGSMCNDPSAYRVALRVSREIFDEAKILGFNFNTLDIGGGFPGHFGTYKLFDRMCKEIKEGLNESFPQTEGKLQIIAEPGNYFVNSACTLCVTVIGRKPAPENSEDESDEKPEMMYYLNDGRYGTMPWYWQEYGADMQFLSKDGSLKTGPKTLSKIWGCSCCCTDCVSSNVSLPDMQVGDRIVVRNMGAYMNSVASNFNGFEVSPSFYLCTTRPQCDMDYRNFLELNESNTDIYSRILKPEFKSAYLKYCQRKCTYIIQSNIEN